MATVPKRISRKIVTRPGPLETPCHVWTGRTVNGYASAKWEGRERKLHRVMYLLLVGPIADGLVLDHLCRNRACLAMEHLEPVTQQENILRGEGLAAQQAARTHCPAGHAYDETNTYTTPSRPNVRYCRACKREHRRAYRARRAER